MLPPAHPPSSSSLPLTYTLPAPNSLSILARASSVSCAPAAGGAGLWCLLLWLLDEGAPRGVLLFQTSGPEAEARAAEREEEALVGGKRKAR